MGDEATDTCTTPFGIRSIRFTADNGFYLNDRRGQFKGICLHHDQGPLGTAFFPRAMERQLEIMKAMGVNAVRRNHNVAAPELLDLCGRMGILVFDEASDKYDNKADITPDTDFDDFAHLNIRNFVLRDRNHPCIFIWSIGNEMGDIQNYINNGFQKLNTMVTYVRMYDPSRPVTMVCDNEAAAAKRHFDYYDVISYNYGQRWKLARQMEPNKAVIISESVPVFIYTNGDAAELFLNGKSLGRKSKNPTSRNSAERFRIMWNDVPFHPGELRAVAYKAGK